MATTLRRGDDEKIPTSTPFLLECADGAQYLLSMLYYLCSIYPPMGGRGYKYW